MAKVTLIVTDRPIKRKAFVFEQHGLLLFLRSRESHVQLPSADTTLSR